MYCTTTDNYKALASLMHYKEWGTYNVHDPACIKARRISKKQLTGKWEIIQLKESTYKRGTYAGQILWGENRLAEEEVCISKTYVFEEDGRINGFLDGRWSYQNNCLKLDLGDISSPELIVHRGLDWENRRETLLFTGLDGNGYSIWGKKIY